MIPLARAVMEAFKGADPQFQAFLDSLPERVSCRKGCAACCELLALITWPEAALVAETLRKRGQVARFLPALVDQAARSTFDGLDQVTYWERRIPCAFLAPDKTCGVYIARPGTCRFYVAFTPPELCAVRPTAQIRQVDEVPILVQLLGPILREAERQAPEMRQAGPIPVMVLAALRNLGEKVPDGVVTPAEWLERHGETVRDEYRRSVARSRSAQGSVVGDS